MNDLANFLLESDFLDGDDLIEKTPQSIGRYRVVGLLGEGASGRVYLAYDRRIGRRVAIKVLQPGAARDPVKFEQQIQLEASLEHENIVSIYDAGSVEGRPYFVMQYAGERSLGSVRLTTGEAVSALCAVARACAAAHAAGIIHRDLKPANILLADEPPPGSAESRDGLPWAVVADFGLARLLDPNGTESGRIAGTPAYMAPEQAQRGEVSPQCDIYAIGVMLYEQLTGRLPFHGDSLAELTRNLLETDPPPPRRICPGVPLELERIALRAMARDPESRYGTADQLAGDLESWLDAHNGGTAPPRFHHRNALRRPTGKAILYTSLFATALAFASWFHIAGRQGVLLNELEPVSTATHDQQRPNEQQIVLRAALKLANWRRELYQSARVLSTMQLADVLADLEPIINQEQTAAPVRQQALLIAAEARALRGNSPAALADLAVAIGIEGPPQQLALCHYQRGLLRWDMVLEGILLKEESEQADLREAVLEDFRQAVRLGLADPWQAALAGTLAALGKPGTDLQQTLGGLAKLEACPEKPAELAARLAGDLLLLRGQPKQAIEKYQAALGHCGSYVQAYSGLAIAYHARRDLARALNNAIRAIEINPRYEGAYMVFTHLARCAVRMAPADLRLMHFAGQPQLKRWLTLLDASREQLPESSPLLTACGSVHLLLSCQMIVSGDQGAAAESRLAKARFAAAAKLDSESVSARLLSGMSCLLLGRYHSHLPQDLDAACKHFRRAVQMAPTLADPHRWLGYAESAAGRPRAAIASWEQAVKFDPDLSRELGPRIARATKGNQTAERPRWEILINSES